MPASLITAGNLWHVLYNGEPVALNVDAGEAERLLDLYEMTERACDRAREKFELGANHAVQAGRN